MNTITIFNAKDESATELMIACNIKKINEADEVLDVYSLIANGENVNARDRFNSTPLMYAVMSELSKSESNPNQGLIIDKLIEKGADVNAYNLWCQTPAILAAQNDDPETLKRLLEHGATDLERRDGLGGKNVYQYAAENSCKKVMDDFKKSQQPEPTTKEAPAPRSLVTRFFDVVLYPFRLIGKVIGSIFRATIGSAINKLSKPKRHSDNSESIHDDIYYGMPVQIDSNPQAETKLTSRIEPEIKNSRRRYDPNNEKKVHLFTDSEPGVAKRDGELNVPGVSPSLPGSPKGAGGPKQEI